MDDDYEVLNISTPFIEICRLCFYEGQLTNINALTIKSEFLPFIMKMFEVGLEFKLPKKVCFDCLQELNQMSLFIQKCKESEDILSKIEKSSKKVVVRKDEKKIKILSIHQIRLPNEQNSMIVPDRIVLNEKSVLKESEVNNNINNIVENQLKDVAKVTEDVVNVAKNKPEEAIEETFEEVINVFQENLLEEVFKCNEEVDDLEIMKEQSDEIFGKEYIEMLNILEENTTEELSNVITEDMPEEVANIPNKVLVEFVEEEKAKEVANVTAISEEIMNDNELTEYMELTKQVNLINFAEKQEAEVNFSITSEDFKYDVEDVELEVPFFQIIQNYDVNNETIASENKNKSMTCRKCDATVTTFKEHYKLSKNCVPRHKYCSECNENFATRNELKTHKKKEHCNKNHQYLKCHICSRRFKNQANLEKHSLLHKEVESFQCEKGKITKICMDLQKDLKPYNFRLSTQNGEDAHQINKRNSSNKENIFCEICKKQVLNKEELILHKSEKHLNPKKLKCNYCDELFHKKEFLQMHCSKMHKQPIVCKFCTKSFTRLSALNKHMKVHTGEKPYECTVCGKSFTHQGYLNNHSLIHKGIKPHTCTVCKKTFTQKGNLTVHLRIHTRQKSYVCHICKQGFYLLSARKRHIIKKHGHEEVKSRRGVLNEV